MTNEEDFLFQSPETVEKDFHQARKDSCWDCRPSPTYNSLERTGYLAGYSDGFHGSHWGAGYDDPPPTYETGFRQGREDREYGCPS